MGENLKSRSNIHHFIMSVSQKVIVIILSLRCSFYFQFSTTKAFKRLQTFLNILFPGFVADLFLMSTDKLCIPTLEHASKLSCDLVNPDSYIMPKFYDCANMCHLLGVLFVGGGIFFFFSCFFVGVFLPE